MSAWMLGGERMFKWAESCGWFRTELPSPGFWLLPNGIVWHATTAWRWVMKWRVCPFVSVPSVEVKGRSLSWYCSKIKWLEWDGRGTKSSWSRSLDFPRRHELVSGWNEQQYLLQVERQWHWKFGVIFSYLKIEFLILLSGIKSHSLFSGHCNNVELSTA